MLDPDRRYSAQLVKDIGRANEELYSQFVAVSVENDQLRLIIRSPGQGRYGLILFKGSKNSDTMVQFSAVMVEFTVEAMERQRISDKPDYEIFLKFDGQDRRGLTMGRTQ